MLSRTVSRWNAIGSYLSRFRFCAAGGSVYASGHQLGPDANGSRPVNCLTMGQSQPGAAHLLSWLWREQRTAASVLIIAVGILLTCASGFAASEITVLSTVQVAQDKATAEFR